MRTSARPLIGRWLGLMLAAGATLGPVEAAPAADVQKQVLVLYSTRRDAQIAVVGDRELPRILEGGLAQGLDYYSEYIDRARFPDPTYRMAFGDFLRLKYQGHRFDLVIAMHDIALEFIEETRSDLFRETPVVFYANSPLTRPPPNSTGMIVEPAFRGTVVLAAALQPDIQQVFVVSGAEKVDSLYEQRARAQLQAFEPRLKITYLSGLPTKELEARLATLPDHSIVYFMLVSRDGAGENFHPLDYVDRVAAVARVPTYCWVDSAMDHGIVGGSLKNQEAEAAAVAKLALRILNGEPADSIPLSSPDLSVLQVDWRQLRRWGISEARVPAGTLIRFREPSILDYKGYFVGAVALLLAQSALIAGLIVQASKRRQAEAFLRVSKAELQMVDARLINVEENERFRIARELHDDVGQRIAALTMDIDALSYGRSPAPAAWLKQSRALSSRARELAQHVQSISRSLHVSSVDELGLAGACGEFCQAASGRQKLDVRFSAEGMADEVPKEVALCVFRVLQEAVTNAVKHACARHVTVALRHGGNEIRLEVADDGIGFHPGAALKGPGLGLISMKERLGILKGEVVIESRPRAGAIIRVRVPLSPSGSVSHRVPA